MADAGHKEEAQKRQRMAGPPEIGHLDHCKVVCSPPAASKHFPFSDGFFDGGISPGDSDSRPASILAAFAHLWRVVAANRGILRYDGWSCIR